MMILTTRTSTHVEGSRGFVIFQGIMWVSNQLELFWAEFVTLIAQILNLRCSDVNVKVVLTIYKDGSSIGEIETEPYFLTIAEYGHVLTKGFDVTVWGDGKFKLEAQAWYQDQPTIRGNFHSILNKAFQIRRRT